MFDLLANSTKRRAIKKALKELELEQKNAQENSSGVTRIYQTEPTVSKVTSAYKIKSALNKPETTAVDLKNFKNWRETKTVESRNPRYSGNPFAKSKFFDDDDDDGESIKPEETEIKKEEVKAEPKKDNSSVALIESVSKKVDAEHIKNRTTSNFSQFEMSRLKQQEKMKNFQELINKRIAEDKAKEEANKVKNTENKLKIEVVVPEDHKVTVQKESVNKEDNESEVKATKKVVNRKPRGKNKRKFDADVISSIDWK